MGEHEPRVAPAPELEQRPAHRVRGPRPARLGLRRHLQQAEPEIVHRPPDDLGPAEDRDLASRLVEADPARVEHLRLLRATEAQHLEVLQEDVPLLGQKEPEPGEVDDLVVEIDLREVGVHRDVPAHAADLGDDVDAAVEQVLLLEGARRVVALLPKARTCVGGSPRSSGRRRRRRRRARPGSRGARRAPRGFRRDWR